MKCYVEFPCDNMQIISDQIYKFLQTNTTLLVTPTSSIWNFIETRDLLNYVPELAEFFKKNHLIPRHAAVTIINDAAGCLPRHIDEMPVVAKLNMPVINTQGWANRWYIDDKLVAEYLNMTSPIILNSQIEHSVEKNDSVQYPRIVASFTFHNEPVHLLA